jgi:hypothetical protein
MPRVRLRYRTLKLRAPATHGTSPMRKRWQPTPQECELIADMLGARRPKSAIAKFVYISESTLRRWLARVRARRHAAE